MTLQATLLFTEKIAEQRHIGAIRRGLLLNMPIVVLGSFAVMLKHLPLNWYQQTLLELFGPGWPALFQTLWQGCLGIMSLLLVISISYFLSEKHELIRSGVIHPATTSVIGLACLVTLIQPFDAGRVTGLPFTVTGNSGLFIAIITALIATELFLFFCSKSKMKIPLFLDIADPIMAQSLACIVPAALTLSAFALFKVTAACFSIIDLHHFIYMLMGNLFDNLQNTLSTALLADLLIHLFWFFGMHGNNMLAPVEQILYQTATANNLTAHALGIPLPEILTKQFFDTFVLIGGSGATFCLILAVLLASKQGSSKRLCTLSIIPGVFNINELLVFGLPIVLNPIYLIPFLTVPVLLTLSAYWATTAGLVPPTVYPVHWTTPPFWGGYLATGSLTGTALQAFNMIIGTVVYLPFVLLAEKKKELEISLALKELFTNIETTVTQPQKLLLSRADRVGSLARTIASDLQDALLKQELFFAYQPQINSAGQVIGVEALLRWQHSKYGLIPPPVIIAIAEEAGIIQTMGSWSFQTAARQLKLMQDSGLSEVRMSVNISVSQLYHDRLADELSAALQQNGIAAKYMEIEITESIALNNDLPVRNMLDQLHRLGVRIAIDDFGMGHSSLRYIKNFPVDTLKIDGTISREVLHNKSCQEIILSIVALCTSLNIEIIVEYVETEPQRNKLKKLGCLQYQGYLYSPALPPAELLHYIKNLP